MIQLRLFRSADPFQQIDSRVMTSDPMSVGRDPSADWPLGDETGVLSRRHCIFSFEQGRVLLRDTSSNGIYIGKARVRPELNALVEVQSGEVIYLGDYIIIPDGAVECGSDPAPGAMQRSPFDTPFLAETSVSAEDINIDTQWSTAAAPPTGASNASLLDAFCEGANLDASFFVGEDPAEVMRRVGRIYQQSLIGLCDLMNERTSVKCDLRMDRTTIGSVGNNPLKWAPPHRLAVDLLRGPDSVFLGGAAAVKASFEDIKMHVVCLMAGSRAAVAAVLDELSPDQIEDEIKRAPLHFVGKSDHLWRRLQRRHQEVREGASSNTDNDVNRAFSAGYKSKLGELEELRAGR